LCPDWSKIAQRFIPTLKLGTNIENEITVGIVF
jgi:hypothetical protein